MAVDQVQPASPISRPTHEEPPPQPSPVRPQTPQRAGPSRASKRKQKEPEIQPQAKRVKNWWDDGEKITIDGQEYTIVRAEKVPGQRKITKTMTADEKLEVAKQNQQIRDGAIAIAERQGVKIQLRGKFSILGIQDGGYYDDQNPVHRIQVVNTATEPVIQVPVEPAEPDPNSIIHPLTEHPPTQTSFETDPSIMPLTEHPPVPEPVYPSGPPRPVTTQEPVPSTSLELPPLPQPIVPKPVTRLVVKIQGIINSLTLYETDEQLRQNFMIKDPSKIKVSYQPPDEEIYINIADYNNIWPTINFKLRKIDERGRTDVYYYLVQNMKKHGWTPTFDPFKYH